MSRLLSNAATRTTVTAASVAASTATATATALALVVALAGSALAQGTPSQPLTVTEATPVSAPRTTRLEFRVPGGKLVGTGTQRDLMKDGQVTAAQLSWAVRPRLAVTGTLAWGRSRDIAAIGSPKLDVFMYDLGLELRSAERWVGESVSLKTFAGLGAGARSYNSRAIGEGATSHAAGYAAVGGELGMRRVGVRLEVRDYASGMRRSSTVGASGTGNDLVVMASLRLTRRASADRR